jgi:hypothetical protein
MKVIHHYDTPRIPDTLTSAPRIFDFFKKLKKSLQNLKKSVDKTTNSCYNSQAVMKITVIWVWRSW